MDGHPQKIGIPDIVLKNAAEHSSPFSHVSPVPQASPICFEIGPPQEIIKIINSFTIWKLYKTFKPLARSNKSGVPMELTYTQLAYICSRAPSNLLIPKLQPLKDSFALAEINSEKRAAMYIAQIAHESSEFMRMEENLNYSAENLLKTWPKRFNLLTATALARQPQRIANYVYANRNGNGDELGGDGWKYRGRGAIGLTFASNYRDCGLFLGIDLLGHPELASTDQYCFAVAAWYWRTHGLNAFADAGDLDGCTRRINGGLTGIELRRILYIRGMEAFITPSLV